MERDPDCIFCKIVAGEMDATRVYEDEYVVAFEDIHPAAPTHILVIPREHRARLSDYTEADHETLGRVLAAAARIATEKNLDDYRTVINCGEGAGQSVWHLHLHLLAGRPLSWPPG